ncbi:zinc-dependent alcohol dehydrogenase [Microbacterium sp. SL75]|uniref:zinc-dependent alcohol dehydrogenase n=1 Tax=Microbacterium sp. SL75 TaxID=2995140 RepID=UPI0022719AB4|nr:alcohol dehydrogenase catalytic domain-containing protein [Microbacterium sp. SL75]WAC70301.1 alcohol dehydrogenase catalytic domain-containing protein [Microbacterium sp. SL75]
MRAAAYTGDGVVSVTEVTPVEPRPDEVVIDVAFVGVCGTDLHIIHGSMDARVSRPLVFGHEMSGTIRQLGSAVTGWSVGDKVTVMPLDWDGTCPACRNGNQHICQNLDFIGIDSPGALQQTWTVPASTLVPLPASLSLRTAALIEPVAVAVHDVRRSELRAGDRAVIIGGGPIGVLIASVARQAGAEVAVLELDPARRELIERLGFVTVDPSALDATAWVEEWTGGAGADVVFEVSGAAAAVRSATGLARVRGTIVIVAIHPTPREIDLQRVFWRELRLLGARVYQRIDFERAIELLDSDAIDVEAVITSVYPLPDVTSALAELKSGKALKVLIDVQADA